eukprot:362822-Chlamydomonas_euryale.AAC.10
MEPRCNRFPAKQTSCSPAASIPSTTFLSRSWSSGSVTISGQNLQRSLIKAYLPHNPEHRLGIPKRVESSKNGTCTGDQAYDTSRDEGFWRFTRLHDYGPMKIPDGMEFALKHD